MKMEAGARIYKAHGTASGVSQPASLQMTLTRKRHCVSCSLRLRHVTREMKSLSGAYKDSEKRRSETKTGSWCILFASTSYCLMLRRHFIGLAALSGTGGWCAWRCLYANLEPRAFNV